MLILATDRVGTERTTAMLAPLAKLLTFVDQLPFAHTVVYGRLYDEAEKEFHWAPPDLENYSPP